MRHGASIPAKFVTNDGDQAILSLEPRDVNVKTNGVNQAERSQIKLDSASRTRLLPTIVKSVSYHRATSTMSVEIDANAMEGFCRKSPSRECN